MNEGFRIFYKKGWAVLTVFPPMDGSRPLYADQVMNRMKLLNIPPVRQKVIADILDRASGEPEQLVPWPEGQSLSSRVECTLSQDGLTASIEVRPPRPGGEEVTEEMISRALAEQGVVFGIDHGLIQDICEREMYRMHHVIARGREPVEGRAARIKYHFVTEKIPFKELRYGRIDLKELNFVQNKEAGDLLAQLEPPVASREGRRVTGEPIPVEKPPEDDVLQAGSNTELRENKILAQIRGNACLKGKAVTVEPMLQLDNVDYNTGNIDFDGSVIIKGTVADGFTVKATGNIETGKCVGRVTLDAGRDLLLKSGVNGDNEAQITTGGDCIARYIEGASLLCRGNLTVVESIMHSTLSVWGNVLLSGGRDELIGGSLLVQGSFWCRKLGGLYETPTAVIIGISPEVLQEYSRRLMMLEKKRKELDETDKLIREAEAHGSEKSELEQKAGILVEETRKIQQNLHQIKKESQPLESSILVVEDRIYGGVRLSFGFEDYPLGKSGIKQVVLRYRQGKISQHGYNPAEPPEISS